MNREFITRPIRRTDDGDFLHALHGYSYTSSCKSLSRRLCYFNSTKICDGIVLTFGHDGHDIDTVLEILRNVTDGDFLAWGIPKHLDTAAQGNKKQLIHNKSVWIETAVCILPIEKREHQD